MKLTFDQPDLLKSVNISLKAVSSKTTMPILQCILIDASADQIRFISNDMELGIETIVKGTIIERGIIALNAKIFSEIIRRLPNDTVTIETNDRYTAVITCEKSKFDIPGKSGDDFAYLPVVEKKNSVTITQFSLRQIINQTIFSIAMNENNKLMTGELFEIKDNRLSLVSLDGHRIAIRNLDLNSDNEDCKVVVPGKTLNEISRLLDGDMDDTVTIYFSDNHIIFQFDDTMVLSRLIDGEYFNISQMLTDDYDTKISVNKQELLSCMNRASLLVRESDRMPVVLDITDSSMELSIQTELGSMDEVIGITMEGHDLTIGFNPKFIIDALKVIDDETVTFYFISPIMPCFIKDDAGSYIYLILPVNISR